MAKKFNVGDRVNLYNGDNALPGTVVGKEGAIVVVKLDAYNGKVVCVENANHSHRYTVGKVYTFVDGYMTNNYDVQPKSRPITSFKDWKQFSTDKWVELVED